MPPEQKFPFEDMANKDKIRYENEMKELQEQMNLNGQSGSNQMPGQNPNFHPNSNNPNGAQIHNGNAMLSMNNHNPNNQTMCGAKGKLKKAKRKKDPNAPKRPQTAFFLYCHDHRDKYRKEHPEMRIGEIAKLLGAAWAECEGSVRNHYENIANASKEKFKKEMELYKSGQFRGGNEEDDEDATSQSSSSLAHEPEVNQMNMAASSQHNPTHPQHASQMVLRQYPAAVQQPPPQMMQNSTNSMQPPQNYQPQHQPPPQNMPPMMQHPASTVNSNLQQNYTTVPVSEISQQVNGQIMNLNPGNLIPQSSVSNQELVNNSNYICNDSFGGKRRSNSQDSGNFMVGEGNFGFGKPEIFSKIGKALKRPDQSPKCKKLLPFIPPKNPAKQFRTEANFEVPASESNLQNNLG